MSRIYSVKEIYYTLQGEGAQSGRPAVFCRFAGCNLWTGREQERSKAVCTFCDTDFRGVDGPEGGKFATPKLLAQTCLDIWNRAPAPASAIAPAPTPAIVLTGGEPMLQVDLPLVNALHTAGFHIAIESNGTRPVLPQIDWICISPKAGAPLVQRSGDELKTVFPQTGLDLAELAGLDFTHFFLQPMDNEQQEQNIRAAIAYCLQHPQWRLGLQMHKLIGID